MNKTIAIIGAGASGALCAYFLLKKGYDVTLFDKRSPLLTLLPTGGGRCNFAHAEYDFKELAKNYPRGEKFLYSVFSKYSTFDTLSTFEEMGIKSYTQENGRIFPTTNSAKNVREIILKNISGAKFLKEEIIDLKKISNGFKLKSNKAEYLFSHVIIAIGGHSGFSLVKNLGVNIINPKPSLVGLNTKENLKELSGVVLKNVKINDLQDDLLFTHFGVSGPIIYTISALKAFDNLPYKLNIDLIPILEDLQEDLNTYPHKEVKNILNKYLPDKVINYVLKDIEITQKAHRINGKIRDLILEKLHNFEVEIVGTNKGEETVTAGGINLDEINPKTMELKNIPDLYCIGEVLNIDGLCGGFNLQNAWSTAYVCAEALSN